MYYIINMKSENKIDERGEVKSMRVSIRKQDGTVRRVDVDSVWVQAVHGGTINEDASRIEDLNQYRLLFAYDEEEGCYKADEGCCETPWECDHDQETRGLVYFRNSNMYITYDGLLP
jgi:hypothetical protein